MLIHVKGTYCAPNCSLDTVIDAEDTKLKRRVLFLKRVFSIMEGHCGDSYDGVIDAVSPSTLSGAVRDHWRCCMKKNLKGESEDLW